MAANRSPWAWIPTLYLAQGLPYVIVMTISVIMYKRLGLGNTEVALYTSWLYLPWVIKPLWSPFIDIFRTKRWWTVTMQLCLGIAFAAVAFSLDVSHYLQWSIAAFAITAFFSATHDVASDGYYMLALNEHQQSMFVGIRTTFYRIAMVGGQGLLVMLAGYLEDATGNVPVAWQMVMASMAALFVCLSFYHTAVMPRSERDKPVTDNTSAAGIVTAFMRSISTFFNKKGAWIAILFILLYRLPEAQLVKLISPFLLDPVDKGGMGLTTTQVGMVYGTVGIIALTAGGIIGGILAARYGLKRCLHPMAWCMSLTCIVFVALSYMPGVSIWVIYACVVIEQLGYGIGTTAFTLYFIYFSRGPERTTHYSLCTGFMALGMMLPGMAAGWLQDQMGYTMFFWWTMICCIATISVCYMVRVPADFGLKKSAS